MKIIKRNTTILTFLFAFFLLSSCVTMKPKSKALRHQIKITQQEVQYEHCTAANNDWMRYWRNQWERPNKMTRIPFTQLYIY